MFNYYSVTITNVEERSKQIWGYHRFLLVTEYESKVALPPPFSILCYIFTTCRWVIRKLHPRKQETRKSTDEVQNKRKIDSDYWWYRFRHEKADEIKNALNGIRLE